jgi:glycerol-3-phosphate dehydrogenase
VNLERVLIQQYGVTAAVANRLASAYGGRAHDVLRIVSEQKSDPLSDDRNRLLSPRFPFLEAEVIFAVRHEWAVRAEDILARRTRLAFLNKDAALLAIPRVVELMGTELGWSAERRSLERQRCVKYMRHFGGSKPRSSISSSASSQHLRMTTSADLLDVFRKIIPHGDAPLDRSGLLLACEMLNYPLSEAAVDDCLSSESTATEGTVSFEGLLSWWNSERFNPELVAMRRTKMAGPSTQGSGILFG